MIANSPHIPTAASIAATVERYMAGVRSGEIVAGRLVKLAVDRHTDDLNNANKRGFYFDVTAATQAVAFFPMCLRHSIGEWNDTPFELQPWQQFITWVLFGWKSTETGARRFRKAYITLARKNGKTTFAAGLALKTLYLDDPVEAAAQVYCVATKEDQAKLLFNEAQRMVQKCPWLFKRSKIRKAPNLIEYSQLSSIFKPLGSDSDGTDGLNPHCIVMDELHAWREHHRPLKEKLSTGGASRRQPLEIIITTAGDNDSLLWQEEEEYAARSVESVVSGNVFDDSYFAFMATIDELDDPLDPAVWGKANPNLGISVKQSYLEKQATEARNQASKHNAFVRYHANRKTETRKREISIEQWAKGNHPLTITPGQECHAGLDLGRSSDFAALALVFPIRSTNADGDEVTRYELLTKCWTCSDGKVDVTRQPFAQWITDGKLTCHRGNAIDFNEIEREIADIASEYNIVTLAYDKTYAREMAMRLQDEHGLRMFEFTQTPRFYNEPFRKFIVELDSGRISHGGDPVLEWQIGNLENSPNAKDEWMPNKGNSRNKIDAVVATFMAFSECLFAARGSSGPMFVS
jgi:phage terminase large subunit-like protein